MIRNNSSCILAAVLAGITSVSAIDVEVVTAKPTYYPGELVEVLITVTNAGTLDFGSTLQTLYTMDSVYTPDLVGLAIVTQVTTPYTWSMVHNWNDYNISLGNHSVVGTVLRYGTSPSADFDVVQPPTPKGDRLPHQPWCGLSAPAGRGRFLGGRV